MQYDQLRRREFITLLGGAASIAWPIPSRGQEPDVPMGTRARRRKTFVNGDKASFLS